MKFYFRSIYLKFIINNWYLGVIECGVKFYYRENLMFLFEYRVLVVMICVKFMFVIFQCNVLYL